MRSRKRSAAGVVVRRTKHLAVNRVAQVETFSSMTAHLHECVGSDRDGQRLACRIGRVGFAFARKHACDVHLERNACDAPTVG